VLSGVGWYVIVVTAGTILFVLAQGHYDGPGSLLLSVLVAALYAGVLTGGAILLIRWGRRLRRQ
jgi:hypothetical protein